MKRILALLPLLAVLACSPPPSETPSDTGVQDPATSRPAVAVAAPSVETVTQAVVDCRFPLPGFFDCAGDTNVYDGEFVMFSASNYGGCCNYTHPAAGTTFHPASMGTWANAVRSWKSRLHRASFLCNDYGCGGFFTAVGPTNPLLVNSNFNGGSADAMLSN